MSQFIKDLSVFIVFAFLSIASLNINTINADTYTISPSDDLSDSLALLQPGDILVLEDGIYTEPLIVNNSGTALNPITIRADNDGGAIIDGGGTMFNAVAIHGDYIHLEGITARDTTNHVIVIDGSNINTKRVAGYNASPSGNNHVWTVGGENIVNEDCIGAGSGRYMFLAYEANNVTWRRCFGYWQNNTTNSQPKSVFGIYGSSNVSIINSYGTHVIPPNDNPGEEWAGVFITKNSDLTQLNPENSVIKGNIFTDIWKYGVIGNSEDASNMLIENNLFLNVEDSPCTFSGTCNINTAAIFTYLSPSGLIKNNSIISNEYGLWMSAGGHTIQNNNFVDNTWAHREFNNTNNSYNNLWNNTNESTGTWTLDGTSLAVDPEYDTDTYGDGAYLFIPSTSDLSGSGASNEDIGANILYQYDDEGNLTNEPLWPWPLEDRIVTETTRELGTTISPTWEIQGGMWRTLTGVYPTIPNNPSSIQQFKADGTTQITNAEWTNETTVVFKFQMTSANGTDSLTPQIEIRETSTAFNNSSTNSGSAVSYSGSPVQGVVTVTGLSTNSRYHVQARVINSEGASSWVSAGSNPNFGVDTTNPTVPGTPSANTPASDSTPTWSWTASTDSSSGLANPAYTIQWSQTSDFSDGVTTNTVNTNTFTHSSALASGTWYFRVKSKDALQHESAYSTAGSVTISSNSNSAPTNITLSANTITENSAVGTTIGTLSTTDPDSDTSFTYTLREDLSGYFEISGSTLKLKTAFPNAPGNSYNILVRSTDAGSLYFEKTFTVNVTKENDSPTNITLSASSINKDAAVGTVVANINTTDPDGDTSFTYSIVTNPNDSFSISSTNLVLAKTLSSGTSYNVTIRTRDSGNLFFDKTFTITAVTSTPSSPQLRNLQIKLVDSNNAPLSNVELTIASTSFTATTDSFGVATFTNIPEGSYTIEGNYDGKVINQSVKVGTSNSEVGIIIPTDTKTNEPTTSIPPVNTTSLNSTSNSGGNTSTNSNIALVVILGLVVTTVGGIFVAFYLSRNKQSSF